MKMDKNQNEGIGYSRNFKIREDGNETRSK